MGVYIILIPHSLKVAGLIGKRKSQPCDGVRGISATGAEQEQNALVQEIRTSRAALEPGSTGGQWSGSGGPGLKYMQS